MAALTQSPDTAATREPQMSDSIGASASTSSASAGVKAGEEIVNAKTKCRHPRVLVRKNTPALLPKLEKLPVRELYAEIQPLGEEDEEEEEEESKQESPEMTSPEMTSPALPEMSSAEITSSDDITAPDDGK